MSSPLSLSLVSSPDLEGQASLTSGIRQRRDTTVVLVAGTVEHDGVDALLLGTRGNELADLAGLLGLVATSRPQVGLHGRRVRQRLADEVVDDLHRDVLGGAGHDQARTLGRTVDALATAHLATQTRRGAAGLDATLVQRDSHGYLPAFPTLRRTCSPA